MRTHVFIAVMNFAVSLLWAMPTYVAVNALLDSIGDVQFFENELPKLQGCIDDANLSEVLSVGQQKTFDQMLMYYFQVGIQALAILFGQIVFWALLIRRCVDRSEALQEHQL